VQVRILPAALDDLEAGYRFYESQEPGAGHGFITALYEDIDALALCGGIHAKVLGQFHRAIAHRYPYAIFYKCTEDTAVIHAVIDCRRNPAQLKKRLG